MYSNYSQYDMLTFNLIDLWSGYSRIHVTEGRIIQFLLYEEIDQKEVLKKLEMRMARLPLITFCSRYIKKKTSINQKPVVNVIFLALILLRFIGKNNTNFFLF